MRRIFGVLLTVTFFQTGNVFGQEPLWPADLAEWQQRRSFVLRNSNPFEMARAPLRLNLSTDLPGFSEADFSPGGADVRFADLLGNVLPSFVEFWDPAAGLAVVWVAVDLSPGDNTILLYFQNPNAPPRDAHDAFMLTYEPFSNGTEPAGWLHKTCGPSYCQESDVGYDRPGFRSFAAYIDQFPGGSSNDGYEIVPPSDTLDPTANYTIDFYVWTNPISRARNAPPNTQGTHNIYFFDGQLRMEWREEGGFPSVVNCRTSIGETLVIRDRDKWYRFVIIRDRNGYMRVRVFHEEALVGECDGPILTFPPGYSPRLVGGNGGYGEARLDNYKVYKNFGWDTRDVAVLADTDLG
ncbi:MAG: hypothetical protein A3H28_08055 [Acidobacteria bacterium RIFCSPLOWO2_02_FULL_61_28]|nr:MAG: hypothetical protein A3H28_08055 [Acidobacteria bacterium RIFCSPLOWO2_02_FULL_61_28]